MMGEEHIFEQKLLDILQFQLFQYLRFSQGIVYQFDFKKMIEETHALFFQIKDRFCCHKYRQHNFCRQKSHKALQMIPVSSIFILQYLILIQTMTFKDKFYVPKLLILVLAIGTVMAVAEDVDPAVQAVDFEESIEVIEMEKLQVAQKIRKMPRKYPPPVDLGYTSTYPVINTIDPVLATTWTSKLKGSLLLSQINIPGTHDSGTSKCEPLPFGWSARCQSMNVSQQLKAGIRYLDLRVKYNLSLPHKKSDFTPENLIIFHGVAKVPLKFSEVVKEIQSFMKLYDKQFIILSFAGTSQKLGVQLQDPSENITYLLGNALGPNNVIQSIQIPSVEQARGKVWIIGSDSIGFNQRTFIVHQDPRSGIFPLDGKGPNKYFISGNYEITRSFTVEQKSKQLLRDIHNQTQPDRLKIIGLGASGSGIYLFTKTPLVIAEDEQGPNAVIQKALRDPPKNVTLGLMIGDFFGPILIDRIIRTNSFIQSDQIDETL